MTGWAEALKVHGYRGGMRKQYRKQPREWSHIGATCRDKGSPTMMSDYRQPAVEAKSEDDG